MKKIIVWIFAVAGALVALLIAAVIVLPMIIDVNAYIPQIERKVSEATGRSFTLGEDVDVSVFPWAGVSFNNMKLSNPQKFGGGEFVTVESFEARVRLLPLLSKKVEIKRFVLNGPEVRLVRLADGSSNWSLGAPETKPEAPAEMAPPDEAEKSAGDLQLASLEVGEFAVNGGRLIYEDRGANMRRQVENITLTLENISLDTPVDLLFSADIDGTPVKIEGSVGPVGRNPGEGELNAELVIEAAEELVVNLDATFSGLAAKPTFNVALHTEPFSPRSLLRRLEIPFPVVTADPEALSSAAAVFTVQGDPSLITIKDSSVSIDDSTLKISAELRDMSRPDVSFNLILDGIDADRYLPPPKSEKESGKRGTPPAAAKKAEEQQTAEPEPGGAEPAPINYQPLRRLVIDGAVSVGELTVHGAAMRNVELKLDGSDGVFTLDPFRIDLYDGSIEVTGNFDVRQDSPLAAVSLNTAGVKVGPLLRDSLEKDVLEGTMAADADITFSGDTAAAVKKSLNGKGSLTFVDGAIVGIDIAATARSLAAGLGSDKPEQKPRTDFAELRVPFILDDGVFRTEDAALRSPLLRVKAMGTANMVTEQLDMRLRPKIVGTLKGQGDTQERSGVTIPLLVAGTFSKPRVSADLSGVASEEALREAVENPQAAKEKIKSLEDTGKQLLKGFGIGD